MKESCHPCQISCFLFPLHLFFLFIFLWFCFLSPPRPLQLVPLHFICLFSGSIRISLWTGSPFMTGVFLKKLKINKKKKKISYLMAKIIYKFFFSHNKTSQASLGICCIFGQDNRSVWFMDQRPEIIQLKSRWTGLSCIVPFSTQSMQPPPPKVPLL